MYLEEEGGVMEEAERDWLGQVQSPDVQIRARKIHICWQQAKLYLSHESQTYQFLWMLYFTLQARLKKKNYI